MKITRRFYRTAFLAAGVGLTLALSACRNEPETAETTGAPLPVETNRLEVKSIPTDTPVVPAPPPTNAVVADPAHPVTALTQAAQALPAAGSNAMALAQESANALNLQFLRLVQEAQNLIRQSQFAEAAARLAEVSKMTLTPEQQELVNELKAAVEKGLASKTGQELRKGLNNILGGSK